MAELKSEALALGNGWALQAFNHGPIAMAISRISDGQIVEVNPAITQLIGYDRAELLGRTSLELGLYWDPSDRLRLLEQLAQTGQVNGFECRFRCKDGHLITTACSIWRLDQCEVAGEEAYMVALFQDISQLKTSLQSLSALEETFKSVVESSTIGMHFYNLNSAEQLILEGFNQAANRLLGVDHQKLVGQMIEVAFPSLATTEVPAIYKAIARGERQSFAFHVPYQDPTQNVNSHYDVNVFRTFDRRIAVNFTDITARKHEEFRSLFLIRTLQMLNTATDLKVVTAKILQEIKEAFELDAVGVRLLEEGDAPYFHQEGYSAEFLQTENTLLVRDDAGEILCDDDQKVCLACLCGLVLSGQTPTQSPYFTERGSFWCNDLPLMSEQQAKSDLLAFPHTGCVRQGFHSGALIPIRDHDHIVGLLQMNSLRKNLFDESMITFMEGLCGSIGVAIQSKRLEEARKRSEQQLIHSSKLASIGTLAAGVAHEINNPLTIAMGYVDLLRNRLDLAPEQRVELFNRVEGALGRIKAIVDGLRSHARQDIEGYEEVDLHKLIGETLAFCHTIYEKANIKIQTNFGNLNPLLQTNVGKFQQILMNLLSNGRDAISECQRISGGVITLTTYEEGTQSVVLKISDNGCGMDRETMVKIFDPFFTTKPAGKGTGLGLSIISTLVTSFGGRIRVDSEKGVGSTFTIVLPRRVVTGEVDKGATPVSTRTVQPALSSAAETVPIRGRILVVDDEPEIRDLLVAHLSGLPVEIEEASDGLIAWQIWQNQKGNFDYLLTDMKMPRMNGVELMERVRRASGEAEGCPRPKIFVISSSTLADFPLEQRQMVQHYAQGYLHKPFTKEQLLRTLQERSSCEVRKNE